MEVVSTALFYSFVTCRKAQVFRYLDKHVDVRSHFWNAYESIDKIYKEMITAEKAGWDYSWEIEPSNEMLGTVEKSITFDSFHAAKETIIQRLANGEEVFIWVRNKYIPHMQLTQMNLDGIHSLALTAYNEVDDSFTIFDYPFEKIYESTLLEQAFNSAEVFMVDYYSIAKVADEAGEYIDSRFRQKMLELGDEGDRFEQLKQAITTTDIKLESLLSFFGVYALSRKMVAGYLEKNHYSEHLVEILHKSSKVSEVIKQRIAKFSITSTDLKACWSRIEEKYDEMKKLEQQFIKDVQQEMISGVKPEFTRLPPNAPTDLKLLYSTDTSAWISWIDDKGELESNCYLVFVNGSEITKCSATHYIIPNLEPETKYEVAVKSMNTNNEESVGDCRLEIVTKMVELEGTLSLHKPVYTSSDQSELLSRYNLVDSQPSTRWSSDYNDDEWACVDLGMSKPIKSILLRWEDAYATEYKVQLSANLEDWQDIHHEREGSGGRVQFEVANASGRYVRMLGMKRATMYGYSLYEFTVC
ncbi:discoidin domain-containing protein [Paenibacillus sp. SC116]|uniref:discoidin domain-containing protein n=1 Tax=Paenibacillus sp. SC116 TaxID=2968986 RepID=UPI00215A7361|nr:discoidin domain-containing protein [Paenibacillus sp. SC116]MCR8842155.1 discoidin domain-containing protein [Paenibacillus sp. SC116]